MEVESRQKIEQVNQQLLDTHSTITSTVLTNTQQQMLTAQEMAVGVAKAAAESAVLAALTHPLPSNSITTYKSDFEQSGYQTDRYILLYVHSYIHTHIPHTCTYMIHTYITYIHTYNTHTHTHIHIYTYTHTQCMCVLHTYTHTHIHTYIHTYTHTHIQTYRHTDIHTYIHTNINTYIHFHFQ